MQTKINRVGITIWAQSHSLRKKSILFMLCTHGCKIRQKAIFHLGRYENFLSLPQRLGCASHSGLHLAMVWCSLQAINLIFAFRYLPSSKASQHHYLQVNLTHIRQFKTYLYEAEKYKHILSVKFLLSWLKVFKNSYFM